MPGEPESASRTSPPAPGTQPQTEAQKPTKVTGKVLVPWNGADREVDIEDLVAQARKGEDAEQTLASAKRLMQTSTAAEAMVSALEQLDPKQQQSVMQFLQNPEAFAHALQGGGRRAEEDEEDPMEAGSANGTVPREIEDRLSQQERTIQQLMGWAQHKMAEESKETLEAKAHAAVKEFESNLGKNQKAIDMVRQTVLVNAMLNPKAKLRDLANDATAGMLKALLVDRAGTVEREMPGARRVGPQELPMPEKQPTGADLQAGRIPSLFAQWASQQG